MLREVAYIAYYFHWPYLQIMGMDHLERGQWVQQVARINQTLNEGSGESGLG